jgi:glutamate carboxypeptidase
MMGTFGNWRRLAIALAVIFAGAGASAADATAGAAAGTGLSADEKKLSAYVDGHREQAVALLQALMQVDSATDHVQGVRAVGELIRPELSALGFGVRWIDMPKEMGRAGHLFAEHPGNRGKRVLLIGHLDTVLPAWPLRRTGNRLSGSGGQDMKSGDVVLLYALKALYSIGALKDRQIIVALTGDEESPGEPIAVSRRDLIEAGRRSELALCFEAFADSSATVARRGSSAWRLEVAGATGHSGDIFSAEKGSGALYEAARVLHAFHEEVRGEQYLTLSPAALVGGTQAELKGPSGTAFGKRNVIAKAALAYGDLRFISEDQKERARHMMQQIVARSLPRTSTQLRFTDSYPAMPPTPANYALLQKYDRASQDLGLGAIKPLDPGERGAGDISFVAPYVAGLDGLGGQGGGSHSPDEYVDLDALPALIKRTALLLFRLLS